MLYSQLFLHINIIIMMYAGILLALSARLAWDPSAYLPVRAVINDWNHGGQGLWKLALFAGVWLCGLVHLAAIAQNLLIAELWRKTSLVAWLLGCSSIMISEVVGVSAAWDWWKGPEGARIRKTITIREHITRLMNALDDLDLLPPYAADTMHEAEENVQKAVIFLVICGVILFLLQFVASVIAVKLLFCGSKKQQYYPAEAEDNFYS